MRVCPNCAEKSIPVKRLILSSWCRCQSCGSLIEAHWLYGKLFNLLIFVVTLLTMVITFQVQGFYAALLLLPLPLGAIGYLKARFCPLTAKATETDNVGN